MQIAPITEPDPNFYCPTCGALETHPEDTHLVLHHRRLLIRGYKVADANNYWWSQCLVCSGCYDSALNPTPANHNAELGWF